MSYSVTYVSDKHERVCELFETKEQAEAAARSIKFYNLLDDIEYYKGYYDNEAVCALLKMTKDELEWAWCNSTHVFNGVTVSCVVPVRQSAKIEL